LGGGHRLVQPGQVPHKTGAGHPCGAEQEQSISQATCRARTRFVAQLDAGFLGEGLKPGLQFCHVLRGRPLLRSERARGTVRSEQRVLHVGRGDQLGPVACRGLQHAFATVGRGGTAEADDDSIYACVARGDHQLADATRGGVQWAAVGFRYQVQAVRLSRFDVGSAVVLEPRGRHGLAEGPGDLQRVQGPAEHGVQHVHETWPTVGERPEHQFVAGGGRVPPVSHRLRGLGSGQRSAETVGSDQYAHDRSVSGEPRDPGLS
jgi:hypothetical protein